MNKFEGADKYNVFNYVNDFNTHWDCQRIIDGLYDAVQEHVLITVEDLVRSLWIYGFINEDPDEFCKKHSIPDFVREWWGYDSDVMKSDEWIIVHNGNTWLLISPNPVKLGGP